MLKICNVFCAFSAITLLAGFMMAESALIGRRIGFCASFISMITTCAVSPTFSRTQINLSDSIVRLVNEIELGLMLMLVSCKCS
uniref:Putative secreted protein n=1 Tax=Anopheles darlingi TaxID=43151 RepID=A0A2M4D0M1_ANODA